MYKRISILIVFWGMLAHSLPSEANSHRELTYRYTQVWGSLIRFLRVDQHCPISEKDKKSGYILFSYPNRDRTIPGSVEVVPIEKDQKHYIRIGLNLSEMPSYVETLLLDKLIKKLKNEYGPEPRALPVVAPTPKSVKSSDGKNPDKSSSETPSGDENGTEPEEKNIEKNQE